MKNFLFLLVGVLFISCAKDVDDDPLAGTSPDYQVKDFIWKSLNTYYLWQEQVPELADNYFEETLWQTHQYSSSYTRFLAQYATPKAFFNALLYKNTDENQSDRFSFLVEDYTALQRIFAGIQRSTGMDFALYKYANDQLLGVVRYAIKGSAAWEQNVQRGDVFTAVNGKPLTTSNYRELLYNNDAELSFSFVSKQGDDFIPLRNVVLAQREIAENPIHTYSVIPFEGKKIGYLLYNGFISSYDHQLNEVFAFFKSEGVRELILDLRYNSGGSVQTASYLASMITGSHTGKIFVKEATNRKMSNYFATNVFFTNHINGVPLHHLYLNRLCVLTLKGTASASELVINGLKPYLEVHQIGETTTGKNLASITIRDRLNPSHKWALQPIVIRSENAAGFGNYQNGISPDVPLKEDYLQMGALGTTSDPFIQKALNYFSQNQGFYTHQQGGSSVLFDESKTHQPYYNEMYLPEYFFDSHQPNRKIKN